MVLGSSPTTSEINNDTTGTRAWRSNPPPLISDRCLRTVLISSTAAPHASNSRVTAILSGRVTGGRGHPRRLDAPPLMRQRIPPPWNCSTQPRSRCAAASPRASGSGCPASLTAIDFSDTPQPLATTTSPRTLSAPSTGSAPAAMRAAALPPPTTSVGARQCARTSTSAVTTTSASARRRCAATSRVGSTASIAAPKIALAAARKERRAASLVEPTAVRLHRLAARVTRGGGHRATPGARQVFSSSTSVTPSLR